MQLLASHMEEPALLLVMWATHCSDTHTWSDSTYLVAMTDLSRFTEGYMATSFTHRRTSLAVSHMSNPLQWHTYMVREHLASSQNRPLSHPLLRIPFGTPSLKNTLLLAWHSLPTNSRTNILTGDTKRTFSPSYSFTPAKIIKFRCCVFKRSFVVHLYCQIIYSVIETNHSLTLKH